MRRQKRWYTPQLHERNVKRLYTQAKRFEFPMTKMLNLIVGTALEELEQVDDPAAWEIAVPVRPEQEDA